MDDPDVRCLTDRGLARYLDPGPRPLMRSPTQLDEYFRLCRELYRQGVASGYSEWMLDNQGGGVLALAAPDAAGILSASLIPMWGPDTVIDHQKLRSGASDWWSGHEQVMRDSIAAGVDLNTAIQDYFDREADSDAPTIEELRKLTRSSASASGTMPTWQTEIETVKARIRRTLATPHDAPVSSAVVGAAMLIGAYPIPETPEEWDIAHHNMAVIEAVGGPTADIKGAKGIASMPAPGPPAEPTPYHQTESPPTPRVPSPSPQHRAMPEPPVSDVFDVRGTGAGAWAGVEAPAGAVGGAPGAGTADPAPLAAPPTPVAPPPPPQLPEVPEVDPRGLDANGRGGVQGIEDPARLGAPPAPPTESGQAKPITSAAPPPLVFSMPHGDAEAAATATTVEQYLAALRRPGVDPGGFGGRWDNDRFDRYPPGEKWRPGDPINAPHQTEGGEWEYPVYNDQGRPRAWRNLAHYELEDRKRTGRAADPDSIDAIAAMSDADLQALRARVNSDVRSPRNRLGEVIELEHVGVQQKAAKALNELGLSASEARRLTKASDPGNLMPVTGPEHSFFDAHAHRRDAAGQKFQHTRTSDERKERPLAPLTDAEIRGLVDLIHQRGLAGNFGRTRRTRNLRNWLLREIQERGLAITL